ncbi:helix-turn-helix domain-containing protein [Kordia sp.]|uniref:helix-turn-helix domain-containing protein n=1 Tax=Kordia sp. TaxID=1965332 RepID=UPI003B5BACDB
MFRFFLCLFFLTQIPQVKAQELTIPTYEDLKGISFDSLQTSFKSTLHANPILGKAYANAYYTKALQNNDSTKVCLGAHMFALAYKVLGQKDNALHFIDLALEEAEKLKDTQQYASSLYLKGSIYYSGTSYTKAIECYTRVYDIIKKDNDSIKLAKIARSISLIKNQIGETEQALGLIKNNLGFYERLKKESDPRFRVSDYINTLLNISNAYANLAEDHQGYKTAYLDSATVFCEKGIRETRLSNDNEAYCIFLTLEGIISQKNEDFDTSIVQLNKAKRKIIELNLTHKLPTLYFYQGKNYFLQKKIDTAIPYFLKVDSILKKNNANSLFLQENYFLLAQCFEQKNDVNKALHYIKIFHKKDAENDETIKKSSLSIYHKYDIPAFTHKIDQLVKDTDIEKGRSLLLKKISFFLLGIIILGLVYYYIVRRNYKRRFEVIVKELNEAKKNKTKGLKDSLPKKYTISDENIRKILNGLELFEEQKKFLQPKCSINFLAKEIDTNATYLSKTLQSHKHKKFTQYITDLRIDYALVQLKENSKFRAYDIKSIALELGFNTSESFSKAFKKKTGIYPSFYIKKLNSVAK